MQGEPFSGIANLCKTQTFFYCTLTKSKTVSLSFQDNGAILSECLKALVALTEGNPDILNPEGTQLLLQLLEEWRTRTDTPDVAELLVGTGTVTFSSLLLPQIFLVT